MPNKDSRVLFKAGLFENYQLISQKDTNTIYFCTDTQQMFVGDTEYTRPIQVGTALPSGFAPPYSLFFNTTSKVLYYSDGTKWNRAVNDFTYTHPDSGVTAGAYGDTTNQTPDFGDTFQVPSFTVDAQGHLTVAGVHTVTIPDAPTFTDTGATDVNVTGSGNAVTTASYDAGSRTITLTKEATFATSDELDAHSAAGGAETLGHIKTSRDVTMAAGEATVNSVDGKVPGAASGLATLDGNTKVPIGQIPTGTAAGTVATGDHKHNFADLEVKPTTLAGYGITQVPASTLTGTISLDNLPAGALERLIVVADEDARLALTSAQAQTGDTVKEEDSGLMFFVVDDTKLGGAEAASAFEEYTVGSASSVPWSGVTDKPEVSYTLTGDVTGSAQAVELGGAVSILTTLKPQTDPSLESGGTFTKVTVNNKGLVTAGAQATPGDIGAAPATHTHNYAGSATPGGAANSVANAITISLNGTAQTAFNGSAPVTFNITADSVGAAAKVHTHNITTLGGVTISGSTVGQVLTYTEDGAWANQSLPVASTTQAGIIQIGTDANQAAAGNHTHGYAPINHTHGADDVINMTGYEVQDTYSAIGAGDSLNTAIGKLEAGVTEAKSAAAAADTKAGQAQTAASNAASAASAAQETADQAVEDAAAASTAAAAADTKAGQAQTAAATADGKAVAAQNTANQAVEDAAEALAAAQAAVLTWDTF